MAESITYDFISRGADRLAGDFRKTGDTAALAARGAKVLQDVIKELGQKEDRTAAQSKILAAALRQTGDAEDRAAAKAVLADAAIRRLDDAMQDSSKRSGELGKALGGLKINPGLLGPALALAPALATLGGAATGAAIGLAGAFTAGAGALAAFGAVAKPVLTDAKTAATAVETAQQAHAAAVAKVTGQYQYAMSVAKTKAQKDAAYAAEQKGFSSAGLAQAAALSKAYADLSPAQIALSKQLGAMASAWDKVKAAETPVVAGALQPWLKSVTDLTGKLGPIIAGVSPFIQYLGTQFDRLVNSAAFTHFRDFIAGTGSAAVGAAGNAVIDLVKSFIILLPQFAPLINKASGGVLSFGQNVLKWASSKKASDDITKFMAWFSANGPLVGQLLTNIGGALKALAPGLTTGGTAELKLISGFFAFVAKLPPAIAKPLGEVTGALLILNKMGVVKAGLSLVGITALTGENGLIAAAKKAVPAIGDMTKAMFGLDAAMDANVVGLVVLAIAALGTAFYLAWKKSAGFRDVIKTIGSALLEAGIVVVQASKIITDSFLSMVGTILHGAADAFGWVPGLGGKLRGASKAFDDFKAGVDNVFTGMITTMRGWQGELGKSKRVSDVTSAAILKNFQGQGAAARRGRDDMVTFTNAVVFNGAKSDAARSARQRLIADLEHSGVQAAAARQLVNNLQASISRMHGKTVTVGVRAHGSGSVSFVSHQAGSVQLFSHPPSGGLNFFAAGGRVAGGVPGRDSVPVMAMPGEVIVPAEMVKAGAVDHLRGRLPGFAAGGLIRPVTAPENFAASAAAAAGHQAEGGYAGAVQAAMFAAFRNAATAAARRAAQAAASAAAGLGNLPLGTGPHSGSAAIAQAFARSILFAYGWGQNQFPPLQALWNQESGWNAYARNPSSGAAGIPQNINGWAAYRPGDYMAQIRWGLAYIWSRYGSPAGAWAHERAFNWYRNGLDAVFRKPTVIGVGDRPGGERVRVTPVTPAGSGGGGAGVLQLEITGSSGSGTFDAFLLKWIRENVRVKGGGSVQMAFGR